jgi:flavin reductase (DIM6/NTAB) family NADH-FMN oxidoreductase RutF
MHACGRGFPSDVSELDAVGLPSVPSRCVKPPRIVEAPVAFECVLSEKMETTSRYVFFGEVKWLSARDGLIDTAGLAREPR